jgi:RNA polymerase sigma-70 factor (ECF subfamily)
MQTHGLCGHSASENVETSLRAASEAASPANERASVSREPVRAEVSFEQVYSTYVEFVWRSARRLGVEEAEADDVVQQVFLAVYQKLDRFEWRSTLKTWLFAILLRVASEHRRTVRRKSPHLAHASVDPELVPDCAVNPHEALSRAEASRTIDVLLDSLDVDKRVVFVMAELEEMTAAEISLVTGLEPSTVYSRLRAARTAFERAAAALRRRELGSNR